MPTMTRRSFAAGLAAVPCLGVTPAGARTGISPARVRAIAREAYAYGFPLVDGYRIQYSYFVDSKDPEYKGPWNTITNIPRVFSPADKAVQTPNSDTPYSMLGLDLRAEPVVLTVPPMDKDRYFSVQLIDLYTFNFDYLGSRATGNEGGSYLIAGPHWHGPEPNGVTKIIRSETELVLAVYRTQLFGPDDLDNVKKVQAGYRVQPLSTFLGGAAPTAASPIDFVKPLSPDGQKTSLEFFSILNFVLNFCPVHPTEKSLMARFARIGVGAGRTFDAGKLSPDVKAALAQGMADAWTDLATFRKEQVDTGKVTSGDMFGTRNDLKNNYLYRMAAAVIGIYGNSKEEAMYPIYTVGSDGQKLDGSKRYTIRFGPGQLPPVNAFWSITLYELPASLLYANPLNRYLLNKPMLYLFKQDADGGYTFHVQNDSPGADREANWLPAPKGPFFMAMRLYWPKAEALDGTWKAPPAVVA